MNTGPLSKSIIALSIAAAFAVSQWAMERTTVSLNGIWDIEDSREVDAVPAGWNHKAPVPGLAHPAQPCASP